MRAVRIVGNGGIDCLELQEAAPLPLAAHAARVRVEAAGLNRADILQRKGLYPAPAGVAQDIPGLEFAGTICELGSAVAGWELGARVMGIVGGGAMAEQVCVDAAQLLRVPKQLSLEQAGGVPEAFLTAFDALSQAHARDCTHVLLHAAPSGVGMAALQLAQLWNLTTIGTSRSAEKLERAASYGLDHAICVSEGDFVELYRSLDLPLPEAIIDLVGGDYVPQNLELIETLGRVILVGLLGGRKAEINLGLLLRKRAALIGTVLRSRSDEEKRALCRAFEEHVAPAIADGTLRPVVDEVFSFEDIREAHTRMEANATFGKIVLSWKTNWKTKE